MAQPFADNGLILCTVIDSDDPEGLGNVRVQYPDFADQPSTWDPVSTMMASGDAGTWFRPKPGDQVLVAFERGDPRFPVVIGSLWRSEEHTFELQSLMRISYAVCGLKKKSMEHIVLKCNG